MRLAILSAGSGWHIQDLQRAAAELGHVAEAVDFRRISSGIGPAADSFRGYDGVLVRTMPPGSLEQVVFRMDVLHRLQARRMRVINPPAALEACVDKYLASAKLEAAGLPVPPTVVCQDAESAMDAFVALGQDVVVKPIFGSEGRGMVRLSDPELAWRSFRTLERLGSVLYVQQYIRHEGWDLRVLVMEERVRAAMRRNARGDWRTNVAQGAQGEKAVPGPKEERLALKAATTLGAVVAGVDLLLGPQREWYVLEVNAVPGWRTLAPVTGIDVAKEVIELMVRGQ